MATYRESPCKYYIAYQQCQKGRRAEHGGYCQHRGKYVPRAKVRRVNKKKLYLAKIRKDYQ